MNDLRSLRTIRVGLSAFALAALATSAHADPVGVTVETNDGNRVAGTLALETIRLKTAAGEQEIRLADVVSIEFRGTEADVACRDGTKSTGTPLVESWRISTDKLGNLDLKTGVLKKITFAVTPRGNAAKSATLKIPVLGEWRVGTWLVRGLAPAAGGQGFWALDGAAQKLVRFSFDPLRPAGEIVIGEPVKDWSVAPGGKKAVAIAGKRIYVLDLEKSIVAEKREFGSEPRNLLLVDEDTMAVSFIAGGSADTTLYSMKDVQPFRNVASTSGPLRRIPGTGDLMAPNGRLRLTRDPAGGNPAIEWFPNSGTATMYGISMPFLGPRHGLGTGNGFVLEISRSHRARHRVVGRVDQAIDALPLPETGRALVFTGTRKAVLVQLEPFKVLVEQDLGAVVLDAVPDPSGKGVVYFAAAEHLTLAGDGSPRGDFFRVALPE